MLLSLYVIDIFILIIWCECTLIH